MAEGLALVAGRGNVEPVGGDSGCGGDVRGRVGIAPLNLRDTHYVE
jgi:hypothetical protein